MNEYFPDSSAMLINNMNDYVLGRNNANFLDEVNNFYHSICNEIEKEKDPNRKDILIYVKCMPDGDREDFELKKWMYNCGQFRTKAEIDSKIQRIAAQKAEEERKKVDDYNRRYYSSGQYADECKKGKWKCWIPVIIDVLWFLFGLDSYGCIIAFMLSPVALTITAFMFYFHANKCEKLGREHNVPFNSEEYRKAVECKQGLKLGAITGAMSVYKSAKSNLNSVTHPDTWKSI